MDDPTRLTQASVTLPPGDPSTTEEPGEDHVELDIIDIVEHGRADEPVEKQVTLSLGDPRAGVCTAMEPGDERVDVNCVDIAFSKELVRLKEPELSLGDPSKF